MLLVAAASSDSVRASRASEAEAGGSNDQDMLQQVSMLVCRSSSNSSSISIAVLHVAEIS